MAIKFKKRKVNLKILFSSLIILLFISFNLISVFGAWNFGPIFRIDNNTFSQVNASGMCLDINNTHSTGSYFVPANSYAELNSFLNNPPSGVSAVQCSSSPKRIVQWGGKVTQYTDVVTGVWRIVNCSMGESSNNTRCDNCFTENAPSQLPFTYYKNELIWNWTDSGCSGSYNSTKQSVICKICTSLSGRTNCENVGCKYHYYNYGCSRLSCTMYSTQTACENVGCYWSSGCYDHIECIYVPSWSDCMEAYTPDDPTGCFWNEVYGCCRGQYLDCA